MKDQVVRYERTDFQGSWSDTCQYCRKQQLEHRKTFGPVDGVIYEHRAPCEPERNSIHRTQAQIVWIGRLIVASRVLFLPLILLLLQQFNSILGWIGFLLSALTIVIVEGIKLWGNPDKWIPGYRAKKEREQLERHWIWHCERNPSGFERLKVENFKGAEEEREMKTFPPSS